MSHMVNLVRVLTASTGTATMTLGAAYSALFMTSAEAGMVNGRTYTYLVTEGNDWELGKGVYSSSGTTLSRVTVLASRISGTLGTTKITLAGTAQVRITEAADDMGALRGTRNVTGTSDALLQNDLGGAVTYSNAASIAVSIAQAGASSSFLDGWSVHVKNTGAGTVTITPTTSTINGSSTLVLPTNMGAFIWSDGTNYHAALFGVTRPMLAANNLADVTSPATARTNLGSVGAVKQQIFTSSGTYTPDANLLYAIIECVGSGGGGGAAVGGAGTSMGGGGGGAGSYSRAVVTAAAVGASKAVTVGAAGTGGASGSNNGTAGSDVSVATLCVGKGGSGGNFGSIGQFGSGGLGGVAGTGYVTGTGASGQNGTYANVTGFVAFGANGGSTLFGGNGRGAIPALGSAIAGSAASLYGAGGGGAISNNVAANAAGGNGSLGLVVITEFCSQ